MRNPLIVVARIPAGQTRFEFSVLLYDDDVREEDETFQLQLSSSHDDSFRTIGAANRALATIADDDRVPPAEAVLSLSHNDSALESVPEGSTQQDITVTASFPPDTLARRRFQRPPAPGRPAGTWTPRCGSSLTPTPAPPTLPALTTSHP